MTYKLINKAQLDYDLERIANAIRSKTGSFNKLTFPDGMISEIQKLSGLVYSWTDADTIKIDAATNYVLTDSDELNLKINRLADAFRD